MLGAVAWALGGRAWLHLRHPHEAHGYDGWYYVLQVRSLLDGDPLFADRSWAFAPMAAAGGLVGDVALGNALVVIACAGLATGLAGLTARRLGGDWAGALGAWVAATSAGHLALSAEFLKNAVGAVPLFALLAWLAHPQERGPIPPTRALGAVALVGLAAMTHKLCGVLALGTLAAWGLGRLARGEGRREELLPVLSLVAVGLVLVGAGTLRTVDLLRNLDKAPLDRWARVRLSNLGLPARLELVALHLAPFAAPLVAWRRGMAWAPTAAGLAVVCAAPGLPFDFESLAWRLLTMGFVPLVLLVGLLRPPAPAAVLGCGLLLLGAPDTLQREAARTPDYAAFQALLPVVQATVPPDGRLVAHRGLCGFLWAEGGIPCETFEPEGDGHGVWRVAYGIDPARVAPFGPVVPLLPAYLLVEEPVWRRFRAQQPARSVAWGLRNPSAPRPPWVYGPQITP